MTHQDDRDPEDAIADRETARHDDRDADRFHEANTRHMVEPSRTGHTPVAETDLDRLTTYCEQTMPTGSVLVPRRVLLHLLAVARREDAA